MTPRSCPAPDAPYLTARIANRGAVYHRVEALLRKTMARRPNGDPCELYEVVDTIERATHIRLRCLGVWPRSAFTRPNDGPMSCSRCGRG